MSRETGAHGVQVVAGSNPACPTKLIPSSLSSLVASRPLSRT